MLESFEECSSVLSHDLMVPLLIFVAWLVLGLDARLHWDEPQYLYTGAFISLQQITADDFNPSGIDGFNGSRIAHVALVKMLSWLFGTGGTLVLATMLLYTALMTVFLWIVYLILLDFGVPATGAGLAALVVAFSPVGLYLAFKTLPDVPALMWSSLAVLAGIRSVHGRSWIWILIGAVALALAALTKHILIWTFVAFALAALSPGHSSMPRTRMISMCLAMGIGSVLIFGSIQIAAGLALSDFLAFMSVARNTTDPVAAKIFHVLGSLGLLCVLFPAAAFHPQRDLTRFFWVWFGIALVPFLVVVPRFEVRYLAPALIPLGGLTVLALDVLRSRLPSGWGRPRSEVVLAGVLVCVVALSSRAVQGLTEHEVEMYSLHRLLRGLDTAFGPGAYAVVTPWEYSTFLYLRLAYPNRAVYDAFDPRRIGRPEKMMVQEKFFDGHVLRSVDQLRAIRGQLVYVGFPEAMPISNLRAWADLMPKPIRKMVLDKLDSLGHLNHMSLSWMWDSPELSFTLLSQFGNYLAYQVTVRENDRVGFAHGAGWCTPSRRDGCPLAARAPEGASGQQRRAGRRAQSPVKVVGWPTTESAHQIGPGSSGMAPPPTAGRAKASWGEMAPDGSNSDGRRTAPWSPFGGPNQLAAFRSDLSPNRPVQPSWPGPTSRPKMSIGAVRDDREILIPEAGSSRTVQDELSTLAGGSVEAPQASRASANPPWRGIARVDRPFGTPACVRIKTGFAVLISRSRVPVRSTRPLIELPRLSCSSSYRESCAACVSGSGA